MLTLIFGFSPERCYQYFRLTQAEIGEVDLPHSDLQEPSADDQLVCIAHILGYGSVCVGYPETYLHPRQQLEVGDMLIEAARRKDVFVITHSEHIMLRILRRIRETYENNLPDGVKLDDVKVIWVDAELAPMEIKIDEDGDFVGHWPHSFFNERMRELY